jgi:phosphate transport system permease protein
MTDAPLASTASDRARDIRAAVESRLKVRHASERRFRLYGQLAIAVALSFLVLLLGRIVTQGASTFVVHSISVQVPLDPARIDVTDLEGVNYDMMVADAILAKLGEQDDEFGIKSSAIKDLMSPDFGFQLLDMVKADKGLIGKTVTVSGPLRANADLYFKGEIKRSSPEEERVLSNEQLDWLDKLKALGVISSGFNSGFFTKSDSTEPEQAGVLGAVVGSAMMLLVTAFLAVPIGVMAAVYLEEFAPKNRWTDVIEVNINNLAAVPSIVYGLLGLGLFINTLGVPRSSPLLGGLVLALMALPTVIIATRSSLKAVPPSIREAALGVGASRTQAVFHHVLPLAMPGVMTGSILALAHALGEIGRAHV